MKITTNYAEKRGQVSLSMAIISQVKLLILFTVDLSRALNHRFCFDLNLVKVTLSYISAWDGKTFSHFSRSVKCPGNTVEVEPAGPFAPLLCAARQPGPPCPHPLAVVTSQRRREGHRKATGAEAALPGAPQPRKHPAARPCRQQACTSWLHFAKGMLS